MKIVVALGLLASFLLARGLFLHHAFFTPVPVFSGIRPLPPPVDLVVLIALGALLLPILVLRRPWTLVLVWCALFAARTAWDLATWQPYFYQYFFMLLLLAFAGRRQNDETDAAVLDASRFLLASMYVWSGIHKLNHHYLHQGIADLLPGLAPSIPAPYVPWIGLAAASLEIALGLGLLWRRSRRIAMLGAVALHVALLASIGPWGQNQNRIVWPWNAAMILLLVVLFHRRGDPGLRWRPPARAWAARAIVVVFFVLGPLCSFVGAWPAYFSFKLYSHNIHWGTIFVTGPVLEALPPSARAAFVAAPVEAYVGYVPVLPWSERELGALLPPEPRVFKEVARRLCPLAPGPRDVLLVLDDPPDTWTGARRRSALWCEDSKAP